MHSCLARQFPALVLRVAIVAGFCGPRQQGLMPRLSPSAQLAGYAASLDEKEYSEVAGTKAREGEIEEAFWHLLSVKGFAQASRMAAGRG